MISTIIFDLGGVLIDWNPDYLFKKLYTSETEMRYFLTNICTPDWNEEQDAGRTLADGTKLLVEKYPEHKDYINAFYSRWEEMLGGEIPGSLDIFKKLKAGGKYKIYALTNWSHETFPIACSRFGFLHDFDGVVVSGAEKMRKPDPKFYQLLLDRYSVNASEALFVDDNKRNIVAAEHLGLNVIHFTTAEDLTLQLQKLDITL